MEKKPFYFYKPFEKYFDWLFYRNPVFILEEKCEKDDSFEYEVRYNYSVKIWFNGHLLYSEQLECIEMTPYERIEDLLNYNIDLYKEACYAIFSNHYVVNYLKQAMYTLRTRKPKNYDFEEFVELIS